MNKLCYLIIAVALTLTAIPIVHSALLAQPCCAVVSTDPVRGAVGVRDRFTGRLYQVNSADLANSLKIGDLVDADPTMTQVITVKGVARTAQLREPDAVEPCCSVVSIAKDKQIANGLLSGIITEAGKPFDAIAPFHGVVIAKNTTTGELHVLEMAVDVKPDPAEPVNIKGAGKLLQTMSPLIDVIRTGDPAWVSGSHGMVRGKTGMYAFKLRGAEGKDSQPWVLEPDPKAEGRFGIVRTNWHEKTSSTYQAIYVYLPGEREKQEYYEFFKREHSVMEGEYDIKVNGMVLEKVPVKAGHATRILMGALRSTARFENQLAILDAKGNPVMAIQGGQTIALPIGTYQLKVGTRMVKVEIKENEVTDF